MRSSKLIGVLIVNIGTPKSFQLWDVYRYLIQFLTDKRVMTGSWLWRQLLVRGLIVPSRFRNSAVLYKKLWQKEGSPLLLHGRAIQQSVQKVLGEHFKVALAMRYQAPSIKESLNILKETRVDSLVVLPLVPQYASATTGSIYEEVMQHLKNWLNMPALRFINQYPDHPLLIEAFQKKGLVYLNKNSYDHVLFSFHGLPQAHIQAVCQNSCSKYKCSSISVSFCYKAQCFLTARKIAEKLSLHTTHYSVAFQSRLGKATWIEPYTTDVLKDLARKNIKKVLVFCPSFVSDCLETTIEIGQEAKEFFLQQGGEQLDLVEGLNNHPTWIQAMQDLILSSLP